MSLQLYDESLVAKLKNWTENCDVHLYGPNDSYQLFQLLADESNDKPAKLPIICLSRSGGYTITSTSKQPVSYNGAITAQCDNAATQVNAIPVSVSYQLDVYTRYFYEADSYARELVFNLINHPLVSVSIPYNGIAKCHTAKISLSGDIVDNSDIPQRLVKGQISCMSILFTLDDAYLFDVRRRAFSRIDTGGLQIDVRQNKDDFVIEHIST